MAAPNPYGALPRAYAFAALSENDRHIILETIKQAEDGDGWIVRLYEYMNCRSSASSLTFGHPIRKAVKCNLLEEAAANYEDNRLIFPIKPCEIKTFRVWF